MTIGPAPMIKIRCRSVRFGIGRRALAARLLHHLYESIKEVTDIVRARARLGMPLETEGRPIGAAKTLQRSIKQRDVGDLAVSGQACRIDCKTVVLRRDQDLAALEVLHRMICAMVTELHFQRSAASGEAHYLVPEADAER